MDLVLLSPLGEYTGNASTSSRIKKLLELSGIRCHLVDSNDDSLDLSACCPASVSGVIAIHAYRSGRLLADCALPYGILFGGTDINEYSRDEKKLKVMTTAVNRARFLIAFTQSLANKAEKLWPGISTKLCVQPHSVYTNPSKSFDFKTCLDKKCGLPRDSLVFILVAGIRPVKDVFYSIQAFSEWHNDGHSNCHLVIVGPELDPAYSKNLHQTLKRLEGVHFIGPLSLENTHAAILASFALLNTSLSEGLSIAVLEAMHLCVPVMVKQIDEHRALVRHKMTGLVFSTQTEFVSCLESLLSNDDLRRTMVENAKKYVDREHSMQNEQETYATLAKSHLLHGSS